MKKSVFTFIFLAFVSFQAFSLTCPGMDLKFPGSNGQLYCSTEEARAADTARGNLYSQSTGVVMVQREPVYVQQQPAQFIAVPNSPGHFISGGNMHHCPTLTRVVGGALGAFGGYIVGKNIRIHSGTLSGGGAIAGALIGSEIACERVQTPVVTTIPNGTIVNQGVSTGAVTVPGACIVDGVSYPQFINKKVECDAKWVEVFNKNNQPPAVAQPQQQSQQVAALPTYGKTPTTINGHTCFVDDKKNGEILADFLDATKNPKKIVVTTGEDCTKERAEFSAKFAQK